MSLKRCIEMPDTSIVGAPAVGGAVLGTWIQQRISTDTIGLLFALLLIGVAIDLIVT